MSELSETARQVLQSLRDKPNLNTPTLIAMEVDHVEKPEIEAALDELIGAGEVTRGATGWKLAG